MKMSKHIRKNCLGCKCAEDYGCQLDYDTKVVSTIPNSSDWIGITNRIPLEYCPKPLTNKDWLIARDSMRKHQIKIMMHK